MLEVTLHIAAPLAQAIGVKEAAAMDLEKYGDLRVIAVREIETEQLVMNS